MAVIRALRSEKVARWLLFMFQLPAQRASQRVSVWRKLQKYGALAWKNSAYILPNTPGNVEKFQWLTAEIRKYHGDGSVFDVFRIEGHSEKEILALFNEARARQYDALIREMRFALRPSAAPGKSTPSRSFAPFNRQLAEIAAIDVFGCAKRKEAEQLLKELESLSTRQAASEGKFDAGKMENYQGQLWVTRPRPEVDRAGSAWLIKRFIDPKARFVFSLHRRAIRFDMFEGEFTHVGDNCTFETLIKRFDLRDKRLRVIAQIIHDADLEDNKFGRSEGKAIDSILKGWGKMNWADEEILRKGSDLFEGLYLTLDR